MNPHQSQPASLWALFVSLVKNRQLALQMMRREVIGRYRGSMMGLAWSFFNPLFMLSIYTFVFTIVFKARWGVEAGGGKADFAILAFVGLIVHGLFAECINRAPTLVIANVNFVKKVIFPLEILPWVACGSALFHAAISLLVLLLVQLLFQHQIPWTAIFFPLILLPLIFMAMGFSWFLASLGVYLRDVAQVTGILTTVLMYISPVFYPVSALPPQYQGWLQLNPLTLIIEDGRNTLTLGQLPQWGAWFRLLVISIAVAWVGYVWFQKTRKGFADVL
ncbi:ABC transporter permease [Dyella ginsengisoli]|uniref:Transport permease protein n=1 Tax=Dyella ginsengisoli TaxID=363848 RepID=A0ABW8JSM5_9GAMM